MRPRLIPSTIQYAGNKKNSVMREYSTGFISSYLQKRSQRRWARLAELAKSAPLDRLRDMRRNSEVMAAQVRNVMHVTEQRLARPLLGTSNMDLPASTDWSHRPEIWASRISPYGHAPARNNVSLGNDLTLYHDCKSPALCLRQIRNRHVDGLSPFALQMDVYSFDGTFMSLVVKAPDSLIDDIRKDHVLRLSTKLESERVIGLNVRMNLKNGPNTEQVNKEVDISKPECTAEFDLAYVPFKEHRAEHIWFDLFFDSPPMNQVILRDLTISRYMRSKI